MQTDEKFIKGVETPIQKWVSGIHSQMHSQSREVAHQSADTSGPGVKMEYSGELLHTPAFQANSSMLNFSDSAHDAMKNTHETSKCDENRVFEKIDEAEQNSDDKTETLEQEIRQRLGLNPLNASVFENSSSFESLSQILDNRQGDPETILQNLGFNRGCPGGIKCRIPDRFLLNSSQASGISVEKFLEENPKLKDYLEEKSVIQNPFEMMVTSPQDRLKKRRAGFFGSNSVYQVAVAMTMVNRFRKLVEKKGGISGVHPRVPLAEPRLRTTANGCRYWSVLPDENRDYLERSGYYDAAWLNSDSSTGGMAQDRSLCSKDDPSYENLDAKSPVNPAANCYKRFETDYDKSLDRIDGNRDSFRPQIPLRFRSFASVVTTEREDFDETTGPFEVPEKSVLDGMSVVKDMSIRPKISEIKSYSCPAGSNFNKPFRSADSSNNTACNVANCARIARITEEVRAPPVQMLSGDVQEQNDDCVAVCRDQVTKSATHRRFKPVKLKNLPRWFKSTDGDYEARSLNPAGFAACSCTRSKSDGNSDEHCFMNASAAPECSVGRTSAVCSLDSTDNCLEKSRFITPRDDPLLPFRGKLQAEFSTPSDSSGYAEADQLDVSVSSLNDVFGMSNKAGPPLNEAIEDSTTRWTGCRRRRLQAGNRSLDLTDSNNRDQISNENDDHDRRRIRRSISSCVDYESILDLSNHQLLCEQLQTSFCFQSLHLRLILRPFGSSILTIAELSEWIEFLREEVRLVECALREFKLTSKRLSLRTSKVFGESEFCDESDDCFRQDLTISAGLQEDIMKEIELFEELLVLRMKRIISLRGDHFCDRLPIKDLASKDVVQTMSRLLREQTYQSSIVNSLYIEASSQGHWPEARSSRPVTPSSSLLLSPLPLFASSEHLIQLNESVLSLQKLLSGVHLSAEHNIVNGNKTNKGKRNYRRLLPACLKPSWMKK